MTKFPAVLQEYDMLRSPTVCNNQCTAAACAQICDKIMLCGCLADDFILLIFIINIIVDSKVVQQKGSGVLSDKGHLSNPGERPCNYDKVQNRGLKTQTGLGPLLYCHLM